MQNGKALDLGVSADSSLYSWLRANAHTYGFVRTVPSENWHWYASCMAMRCVQAADLVCDASLREYRPGSPKASYT